MFKLLSLAGLMILGLTMGCADSTYRQSPYWDRADQEKFSPRMLADDQDACRLQADTANVMEQKRAEIILCMEAKGWVWTDETAGKAPERRSHRY
jgi:hypothetical protein